MTASILGIGTAVPETRLRQEHVRDLLASQPGVDRLGRRRLHAAFDAAAIDTRHTVLGELAGGADSGLGMLDADAALRPATTGERSAAYRRAAPPLSAAAARSALARADVPPEAVTHVVTISCTGLFAPGPDALLVADLGLSAAVERDHLGFVGCAAAIPGLRAAARIAALQPDAVVLVVATELCSLHIRSSVDPEQIVAASLFADGAAAAVVSARTDLAVGARMDLDGFGTRLVGEGADAMVWTIGDTGFEMTLTPEVPRIIGREILALGAELFGSHPVDRWAVHPGGRSILDRVESGLGLDPAALDVSRAVLREYGNMSSATILFVLARMLDDGAREGDRIAALAFGPGLTVEAARLTVRGAANRRRTSEEAVPAVALATAP